MDRTTTKRTRWLGALAGMTLLMGSGAALAQRGQEAPRGEQLQPDARERRGAGDDEQKGTARVDVRSQQPYGAYVVDARGMSLYLFEPDKAAKGSTCYGECAKVWPPLLSEGDPRAAAPSLEASQLGTVERRDGSRQVTYAGWPLYLYAPDARPGDTKGQDVHSFGGGWYLVAADGQKIEATKQSSRGQAR